MNALALEEQPHRFTVDDLYAMVASGVLEGRSVELIDGVFIDMPADSPDHIDWMSILVGWLHESLEGRMIVPASTLRLDDFNGPVPDIWVFPAELRTADVRGALVDLAVEVANTSLRRDTGWKADLYARFGVRDYWVADVETRRIHVHREPGPAGYGWRRTYEANERVEALLLPALSLVVDDLPRIGRP